MRFKNTNLDTLVDRSQAVLAQRRRLETQLLVEAIVNMEQKGIEYEFCHHDHEFKEAYEKGAFAIPVDENYCLPGFNHLTGYISRESINEYNSFMRKFRASTDPDGRDLPAR